MQKKQKLSRKAAKAQRYRKEKLSEWQRELRCQLESTSNQIGENCHDENELSFEIIGAAIEVHRILGPGLLESGYEKCLCYELRQKGFQIDQQLWLPMRYKEMIVKEKMKLP
ncbi:GxxExxY protein [candidate division KSB1 bacterium]|nr:GxxExxY protein [candidate division KSB1 bacterium]